MGGVSVILTWMVIAAIATRQCSSQQQQRCSLFSDEAARLHDAGVEYFLGGDLVESSSLFAAAAALGAGPSSFEGLGAALFQRGHYSGAADAFLASISTELGNKDISFANMRIARDWEFAKRATFMLPHPQSNLQSGRQGVVIVASFFRGKGIYSEARFHEILEAQIANLQNPAIKEVLLVADITGDCDPRDVLPFRFHDKLTVVQQNTRGYQAPSWGELFRTAVEHLPTGETVVFAHADIAFFAENASLAEVPQLLVATQALNTLGAPRPVAIALTRRPNQRCLWGSGGGHGQFDLPVDLCTGPHGAAEGVIGYDAFAFILPPPPSVLVAADALRTNRLGSDLRLVEALSTADMLILDPCLTVAGTHMHCTRERSYKFADDLVERADIESGRYSRVVRIAGPQFYAAQPNSSDSFRQVHRKPPIILSFPHSGGDYLRHMLDEMYGLKGGSVDWDAERFANFRSNFALNEGRCANVPFVLFETPVLGPASESTFLSSRGRSNHILDGVRRTRSDECTRFLWTSSVQAVRVLLVRDPFETLVTSFLYKMLSHRAAHTQHRRTTSLATLIDSEDLTWRSFALTSAVTWVRFHEAFAELRHSGLMNAKIVLLSNLESETLSPTMRERNMFQACSLIYQGDSLEKCRANTTRKREYVRGGFMNKTNSSFIQEFFSLSTLMSIAFKDSTLRSEVFSIVGSTACDLGIPAPENYTCSSPASSNITREPKSSFAARKLDSECFPQESNGVSRCVVAFSLYGNDEKYCGGAISNARKFFLGKHHVHQRERDGALKVHALFRMRIYHDSSVPQFVLSTLEALSVELIDVTQSPVFRQLGKVGQISNPRCWRFAVASDPKVVRYLSRDVDSRIGDREAAAIDAWVVSNKRFHVMRDHPSHALYARAGFTMQAGMWGGITEAVPEMLNLLKCTSDTSDDYYADQVFLRDKIWPLALQRGVLQHDSFSCDIFLDSRPFPVPRRLSRDDFVGAVIECDGKTREDDNKALAGAAADQPDACKSSLA